MVTEIRELQPPILVVSGKLEKNQPLVLETHQAIMANSSNSLQWFRKIAVNLDIAIRIKLQTMIFNLDITIIFLLSIRKCSF